jgi:16S rRNA (cytosine1402-N4)-methyltransferase
MTNHMPVQASVAVEYLVRNPDGLYVDGTVGCAAHARMILERLSPSGRLWGFDWDVEMLKRARAALGPNDDRVRLFHAPFSQIGAELAKDRIQADGILIDLGLNSVVLDDPARGFSYRYANAPLDMRMDLRMPLTAAAILAHESEDALDLIFHELGGVRRPRAVAHAIVLARAKVAIATTGDLSEVLRRARALPGGPAELSRVFQALRYRVNGELEDLDRFISGVADWIAPGGRLIAISYESLSDRRLKALHKRKRDPEDDPVLFRLLTPHVIRPDREEVRANPRARSAKLRAMERTGESCPA